MMVARAIECVVVGGPAGLSMVSSGAMDQESGLVLSLPAVCLEFNKGVWDACWVTLVVDTTVSVSMVTVLVALVFKEQCLTLGLKSQN